MKTILVTWWTWFIWSHTVVELIESWYHVIILDDLSNSVSNVVDAIWSITWTTPDFYVWSILDETLLEDLFSSNHIDGVIHFAAKKAVWESCDDPFWYYATNISWLINLLTQMVTYDVRSLIFSSSATVYDVTRSQAPFSESSSIWWTTNPYGTTKLIWEQLIRDIWLRKSLNTYALRYFNPIWAHPSWLIGENSSQSPTNLLPILLEWVRWIREQVSVYGTDYPTPDGTCIRDYVHVCDVAEAHVVALGNLLQSSTQKIWYVPVNIGTWTGTSVQEMCDLVQKVTEKKLSITYDWRRDGDVAISSAQVEKAKKVFWWEAKRSVELGVKDAWEFVKLSV